MDTACTGLDRYLVDLALERGAAHAAVADAREVKLDPIFRTICASNSCGMYNACWTCPPSVGDVETVTAKIRTYSKVLVLQTIGQLEDSYDFEGMTDAARGHRQLVLTLQKEIDPDRFADHLFLTVGGCRLCPVCSKKQNQPCRHPEYAIPSLESYCIHVSDLAKTCHMNYINGANTVTYFSALFYNPKTEG